MIPAATRPLALLAGWAVPILAVLCCAPSVARAGCGDYVITRLDPHTQITTADQQHPAQLPTPRKPCNGPHCSRGPAAPLLPVPTVAPPAPQEWGSLLAGPAFGAPDRGGWPVDTSASHPFHLAISIFHPPRLAA
jgi:hypothetical protein